MSHPSIPGHINHDHLSDIRENEVRLKMMGGAYNNEPMDERQYNELVRIRNGLRDDLLLAFRRAKLV